MDNFDKKLKTAKKKYKARFLGIVVGLIVSITLFLWLQFSSFFNASEMVRNQRVTLARNRILIGMFKEAEGRYPNSLDELTEYIAQNPDFVPRVIRFAEHISDPNGNSKEFNVLNGEGGWYYDKNTGELRFNLTKPVKHYLRFYLGIYRNEIPADW